MSLGGFVLGVLRLVAMLAPAWLIAHGLRRAFASFCSGAESVLADAVGTAAVLLVVSELLGLVGLFRTGALIALLWVLALACLALLRRRPERLRAAQAPPARAVEPASRFAGLAPIAATVGVVGVAAQWLLQSANALGAGMLNFDTLWYHMPLAASFAGSGSVTAIQFTLADPYVAYYPANSELLHAVGILALHGDFLSPLLNLLWLSIALLAAWCLGRRWRVQSLTLLAVTLVISLPVLSGTQPGEAFNDMPGLACLLAACALGLEADRDPGALAIAGLALGLAAGTKFNFLIAAFGLIVGLALLAGRGHRRAALLTLTLSAALTGGWWYLRNLLAVGNPLGLGLHLGPLRLPGPSSAQAAAQSQTVISELGHLSLWSSRFQPGLDHAIGPLWPLVAALFLAGVLGGLLAVCDPRVRMLALLAALVGISYLVLPTGASGIEQDTTLFEVNLRYATPALALAIPLVAIMARRRAPTTLPALAAALLAILLVSQLEHSLWPTQTSRHLVLLAACGALAAVVLLGRGALVRNVGERGRGRLVAGLAVAALAIAVGAAAFLAQRHYYARRYLVGFSRNVPLGTIYKWAQGVSHARVALYGSAEQYPLYGARDTNAVDYLGEHTGDGGYRPISGCEAWRGQLAAGGYSYVVLTPAPTRAIPLAWTAQYPGARLVMNPAPDYYVFSLHAVPGAEGCS